MTRISDQSGRLESRAGNRIAAILANRQQKLLPQSWLIVYLDIITLMLAMFILLVNDPGKVTQTPTAPKQAEQPAAPAPPVQPATPAVAPPPLPPETIEQIQLEPVPAKPETAENEVPETDKEVVTIDAADTIESIQSDSTPVSEPAPVLPAPQVTESPNPEPGQNTEQGTAVEIQDLKPAATDLPPQISTMPLAEPAPSSADADRILQQLQTIDGDQMVINIEAGQINLQLPETILFETAKTELLPAAVDLLKKIAPVLVDNDYPISIEGHTDNVPIQTSQYPSNWELSAARATVVLRKLAEFGIAFKRMKAIGYADTSPISENDSEQGRGKNRRVNIIIHASQP